MDDGVAEDFRREPGLLGTLGRNLGMKLGRQYAPGRCILDAVQQLACDTE